VLNTRIIWGEIILKMIMLCSNQEEKESICVCNDIYYYHSYCDFNE
jgi:hypothetical protein